MQEDEDTTKQINIVIMIANSLGIQIRENEIRDIHRIPSYKREQPLPLIASFISVVLKNKILSAYYDKCKTAKMEKQGHPLHSAQYGFREDLSVFLSMHLTPKKKLLFKKARETRNLGVNFVWERWGIIYAKVSASSKIVKISNELELNKFKATLLLQRSS
jgi:hypothetical protein